MPVPDRTQPGVAMKRHLDVALRTRQRGPEDADAVTRLGYIAADIRALRDAERLLQHELEGVLTEADREGRVGDGGAAPRGHREALVRIVEGAASRARVFGVLRARDVEGAAFAALRPVWADSRGDWSLARPGGRVVLRGNGDRIDVQNEAFGLLEALRGAGLTLASTGPGERMSEDLANGYDVVIGLSDAG